MQFFSVDSNSQGDTSPSCNTCCCSSASAKPGVTEKWTLNFAAFANPIGGFGLVQQPNFSIDLLLSGCNNPSVVNAGPAYLGLAANNTTPLNGSLASSINNPKSATLTYSLLSLFSTQNGSVVVNPDGTFTYTPNGAFVVYDRFYFSVTDGVNPAVVQEAIIGVPATNPVPGSIIITAPTASMASKELSIEPNSIEVNSNYQTVSFGLACAVNACIGSRYRLSVLQKAADCNGAVYSHISCYDITITSC